MTAVLIQNIERLDENVKEESEGVHNTMGEIQGEGRKKRGEEGGAT